MKARGLTREQVMNDVLLAAQPTKKFVTVEQVAALALFLCRDEAERDHRRQPLDGRRLDRAIDWPECGRSSSCPDPRSLSPACTTSREVVAPPTAERPNDGWRALATEDDRAPPAPLARRLDRGARRRPAPPACRRRSRAKAPCSSPTRRWPTPAPPPGDYRCRTIKLGAQSARPARLCRLSAASAAGSRTRGDRLHFTKLTGSQRPIGILFPDNRRRMIFLGTLQLGDEARAYRYGRDRERDMIGLVERVGDRSLAARLALSPFRIPARRDRARSQPDEGSMPCARKFLAALLLASRHDRARRRPGPAPGDRARHARPDDALSRSPRQSRAQHAGDAQRRRAWPPRRAAPASPSPPASAAPASSR